MSVSIAFKNLFENRIKFILSTGGVALVMLLILVLDGVFTGAIIRVSAYMDNIDFNIMVSQKGVKNLHMTTSFFPQNKVNEIKRIDGVKKVNPILYSTDYLVKGNNRSVAYIIGYQPGEIGGPWDMAKGTRNIKHGQIIIDRQLADSYGLKVGDKITTLGQRFEIGGLASGTINIVNSIAFIRFDDFQQLRNLQGIVSYALVTVQNKDDTGKVIGKIRKNINGVTVASREAFSESEKKIISDMSIDIIRFMNTIAFMIGLAALALTVYTSTLSKLKEYGILKAIGSKNKKLISIVVQQAIISTSIGLIFSIILGFILAYALSLFQSNITIAISFQSIVKVFIGAMVINLLASSVPIIRIAGLDPADVFRR